MLGKKVPKNQRQQNNNKQLNNNQKPKEEQKNFIELNTVNSHTNQNVKINAELNKRKISNLEEQKKIKVAKFDSDSEEDVKNNEKLNLSLSDSSAIEEIKPKKAKKEKKAKQIKQIEKEISQSSENEHQLFAKSKKENGNETNLLNKKKAKDIDMLLSDDDSKDNEDSSAFENEKIKKQKKQNKKQIKEKDINQIEYKQHKDEDEIVFEKNKFYEPDEEQEEQEELIKDEHSESEEVIIIKKKAKKEKAAKPKAKNPHFTVSIVIPSSIIDNAQSKELRSYLIGQIARTAGIFKIDEIIIFHDRNKSTDRDYINFFVTNLQYLETPQYLRKTLFPRCEDLANCGLMNPLDSNHHLRIDEWCQYREGVVLNRPVKENEGSWCNIGLLKDCKISQKLHEKTRVTVKLNEKDFGDKNLKFFTGNAVSVSEPKEKLGLYWGYLVRIANNFEEVFSQSSFNNEKYDFIIGTSDKGKQYKQVEYDEFKDFKHCLIVFGGLSGIEGMIEFDEKSKIKDKDIEKMFDVYLNTCPEQGCRTIRTEEAVIITLSVINPILNNMKQL